MVKTLDFSKIGVMDKELLDKINSEMISDIISQQSIYHYTSINVIKKTSHSKKPWFTHIDHMNDQDEAIARSGQLKKVRLENCAGQYSEILENLESAKFIICK